MAAPVPPGAPRPNNNQQTPPASNYMPGSQANPNMLADNMQNLSINRPPPPMASSGPRPPPPFGYSQPMHQPVPPSGVPQSGSPQMSRPGPPPPAAFVRPGGPQPSVLPSNVPLGRPTGLYVGQPPFGSRPASGSMPSNMGGPIMPPVGPPGGLPASGPLGGVAVAPPPGARLGAFGSPPTMGSGPAVPPSGMVGGLVSNGPPMMGPGAFPRGSQFPAAGITPQAPFALPPAAQLSRAPLQPPAMRSLSGSSPLTASATPPAAPLTAFPGAPHNRPAVTVPPYGAQTWPLQPQQVYTWRFMVFVHLF